MTFYEIKPHLEGGLIPPYIVAVQADVEDGELGYLAEVVACEHGNYAQHAVINASYDPALRNATKWDIAWCNGKPL